MKKFYRTALAVALSLPALGALAQPVAPATEAFALRLAVGDVVPPANATAWLAASATTPADAWQGRVYRLLQFSHLPTEAQKAALRRAGVVLFDYLPLNAYTASLPATLVHSQLAGLGLRSIAPMPGRWKLAGALAQGTVPGHAQRAGGRLEVVLTYHLTLTPAQAIAALPSAEFQVVGQNDFAHQLNVVLPEASVVRLAELPWVSTVEAAPAPGVPENFRGRTDHRANALAADYGAGRHYDGRGVTVGHGDDGAIGPHIDFQGRVDVSTAGPSGGDHGDHVAGTIMGAGNLDPRHRGQAVGAFNFYQNYPNNITQAPANYNSATRRVRITSSSYGDGNNAGYTSLARSLDQQMRQLPFLMHVFSAGNSGTSDFGYGAGAGWGNITGGQKMAKNVLTVGNLDYRDALAGSSSRGPANDGRIKPEVCAVGTNVTSTYGGNIYATISGTSMACPGVSGVSAQLVGAYRSLNTGAEMPAALLKALLMNTAEDLGNPGPDFRFGYGRINGLRAVRVLEGRTYFRDSLTQGQVRTFTVPAAAGKKQLRVLLHWTDYEGAANARPALVNNLDLTGLAVGTTTPLLPWILDHRPTVAQLNTAAGRGRDSINNTEQITIDNPSATGGYSFTVTGQAVPQGRQGFWLTYSYIDEGVELTYPLGGEGFVPGETEVLRWDAADSSLPYTVEYTTDNGATYLPIAANLAGTVRSTDWIVPAGLAAGRVKVRVTRGPVTSQSPEFFTIAPQPAGLRSEYRCTTESRLSWTASTGATAYTVYKLGALYMDSVTTVTRPFVVLPLGSGSDYWFAVRARGANGLLSRRTRAIYQPSGPRDCPGPPLTSFEPSAALVCPSSTVLLSDSSQSAPTSWAWVISPSAGVTFVNGTSATSQNPRVQFANAGTYTVALTATNSYGPGATATRTNLITVTNGLPVAFSEDFRAAPTTFPPAGWRVINPSSNYTWALSTAPAVGPDNANRRLPMVNNYDDRLRGAEDFLLTPPLNLAGTTSPELTFAVAYQPYGAANNDGLRVDISVDCGTTFVPTGYLKRGAALATVATPNTSAFAPTSATQWRQETVDLRPFRTAGAPAGQVQSVMLRFVNLNDYGNNLYLTNVGVAERVISAAANGRQVDAFTAAPVPFAGQLRVNVAAAPAGAATLQLLDALGREVRTLPLTLRASTQQVEFDTENLPAGVYVLRLRGASGTQQLKVLK
ncbi:S8 family serine peptidase [Hymenobacter antarcticus]|uniref:PKD domain-containing protein n=1 Tax=Hymenobacter antarcticus TaxID=486270 RepID=A0ABP7P262_9BACT